MVIFVTTILNQMEKIFTKEYRVTHRDTDLNGRLSLASLGSFVLDTAGLHAIEIHTSMEILNSMDLTWVVTGIHFAINEMPTIHSLIKVTTKINEISRLACKRDFLVEHEGKKVAEISTEWLIINVKTRRPVFLADVLPHIKELVTPGEGAEKYKHLRFAIEKPIASSNYTIRYADIDINRHLYSMRYIELAMDMVDLETHQSKTIVSADVNYISEVLYNQQVTLIINQEGDTSQIEMLNADQKPMFRAEFVWKDK